MLLILGAGSRFFSKNVTEELVLLLNSALYSYIRVAQGQLTQPTSKRYNERDEPKSLCDADLAALRNIDKKVQT